MARKQRPRRVISFIGNNDLRAAGIAMPMAPTREGDPGPLWRFISHRVGAGALGDGDCIMLLDDRPESGERASYQSWLRDKMADTGKRVQIERLPLALGKKPTNLNLLFQEVFKQIPDEGRFETQFLVSPGTPAMYATLVLAAEYLKLTRPRVFESSMEEGVVEIQLPYDIGLRPRQRSSRALNGRPGSAAKLPNLLPHTSVADPGVNVSYWSLHKRTKIPTPWAVLVYGPSGSGKTHAARQLARWRGCNEPYVLDANIPPTADALVGKNTVIVRNVQAAESNWEAWRLLLQATPQEQFVFLWCIDADSDACIDHAVKSGLAPGGAYRLPGLPERDDAIALVECFARREGKWDGKAKERFQYPLMKHDLPCNLHELEAWVATAAAHSEGQHVTEIAVQRATLQHQTILAEGLLQRLARVIVDQSFVGKIPIDVVLKCVEALLLIVQEGGGDTQEAIAKRLGVKRPTLFDADSIAGRRRALAQVLETWPDWPRLAK